MSIRVRWVLVVLAAVVVLMVALLFAPPLFSGTHSGEGHSHSERVP
jgi:hypothetical protein